MRRLALVVLALAALVGCGSTPKAQPTVPKSAIRAPLESARTPQGAVGADKSHFVEGLPPLTLAGGNIHIDAAGLTLIENFEEVYKSVYCPYWDAYGHVWTRGFGETDWGGNFGGRCISHSQAEHNLAYLVEAQYQYAVRGLGRSYNHHQIDALDSFVWNLGAGIFTGSLRYSIQHYNPYPMLAYDRAGGVVLSGLASRRRREVALFLTPEREESPSQKRTREKRELATAEGELAYLRHRIVVLRRELLDKGCRARKAHHQKLGPTCRRWFAEGDLAHSQGVALDAKVKRLEAALR